MFITLSLLQVKFFGQDELDLDAAAIRVTNSGIASLPESLWEKFNNFLADADFSQRCVNSSLDAKFPELSQVIPRLHTRQLIQVTSHLRKLHFLTNTLKEAYEDIFYMLEFSIEELTAEDTNRIWGCIANCGYKVPNTFFEKLDQHTAKESLYFGESLLLSTFIHLTSVKEGRAFNRFVWLFSLIDELTNPNDIHNHILLTAYLKYIKDIQIILPREMRAVLKRYKNKMVTRQSNTQNQVMRFLKVFNPEFKSEVFNRNLDMYLDIADGESKLVVEVDGFHHYKEDTFQDKHIKRPLDIMKDAILQKCGWKVVRVKLDEWAQFKENFTGHLHERDAFDTFLSLYTV